MYKVKWFSELLPQYKILEEKMLNIISSTYKIYWYTPIETPMVEDNFILTSKWWWEVKNQIFWLYGLANWIDDVKDYSLRFDLTVPFSRYVLDYKSQITFPFKRSQIWKVFRWERAQRWRYKDFYQADIDVIWEKSDNKDYLFYDAEVISVAYNTFLKIFDSFSLNDTQININLSNRKIFSGFINSLGLKDKLLQVSNIVDKKAKITKEVFDSELLDIWLNEKQIEKISSFLDFEANYENLEDIKNIFSIENREFDEWIKDLKKVLYFIYKMWINREDIKINFSIIRWLDYYTWIVFETFIVSDRKLWSIGSGGRYENLTKNIDAKENFSWVGFSIWVTRLEDYLFENVKIDYLAKTTSEYLIINFPDTITESLAIYNDLIKSWKSVEFYPEDDKLSKQFKYADNKKIKFCVILWAQELEKWVYILKNMFSWESSEEKINY